MQFEIELENGTAKLGDEIGFKCDVEQSGILVEINGDELTLESEHGFCGNYIGGDTETTIPAKHCWVE